MSAWGKQAHPCKALKVNMGRHVDSAGLGRRTFTLPREVSSSKGGNGEKSADAIVVGEYGLR